MKLKYDRIIYIYKQNLRIFFDTRQIENHILTYSIQVVMQNDRDGINGGIP